MEDLLSGKESKGKGLVNLGFFFDKAFHKHIKFVIDLGKKEL